MTAAALLEPRLRLPRVVPIFPLPGALLLPRGQLPLHIFEPRYRAMMRDALAGSRAIAMVQPHGDGADGEPPVFAVGCLGAITAWKATEDGRFYLNLTGLCRLRIAEELAPRDGYRRVVADYAPFECDLLEDCATVLDRERLDAALLRYLEVRGLAADWDSLSDLRVEALVDTLAMLCPFAAGEKQALLEAVSLAERAEVLVSLLEMSAVAPPAAPPGKAH